MKFSDFFFFFTKLSHLEIGHLGISLDYSDVLSDIVTCPYKSIIQVLHCCGFVLAAATATVFDHCQGLLCGLGSLKAFTHHLI